MIGEKGTKGILIFFAILNLVVQFSDNKISLGNWLSAIGFAVFVLVFLLSKKREKDKC